jgi:hypothetical protein
MLCEFRAHQQSAVAASLDGEMLRRCVFLIDQELCTGSEIIEDILFVEQVAASMPALAILCTTAQVGGNEDAAVIEPEASESAKEPRRLTDGITAVARQESGICPIEL